jgi:hypothetical protein
MHARPECKDTPEVNRGADDENRTRGLDHGVVPLCLLSYIRMFATRRTAQLRFACRAKL